MHSSSEISSGCTRTRFSGTSPAPDKTKKNHGIQPYRTAGVCRPTTTHATKRSLYVQTSPLTVPRPPTTPLSSSITCIRNCKQATSSTSNRQAQQRATTSVWGRANCPPFFPYIISWPESQKKQ
ncbi:unnamed protein product [Ectocarpus sp. 8 AP-2014]